jgi:hypothetical protein
MSEQLHTAKYRIWALHCPFNKKGFPVVGSFGSTERSVIIIPVETWKRLCADVQQLQTTQFEVGSYET